MEEKTIKEKGEHSIMAQKASVFFLVVLLSHLVATMVFADQSAYRKNEQGNRLYQKEKFQEALKKYTEAQLSLPESLELHYNIGNVLYKQGQYVEAEEEYTKSIFSDRKDLKAYSHFNRGNAQFMQQNLSGAIDSYIESLKIDPDDRDAKRNLELALQKLQESQKSADQQEQDQSSKPEERKPQPQQEKKEKFPEEESSQRRSPDEGKSRMDLKDQDREMQQRLLNAIEEQEKEALKKSLKRGLKEEEEDVEKDW